MTTLDSKERKARKEHKCSWCNGVIVIGEVYDWQKNVYEGNLYEWKNHKHCMEIAHHFDMFENGDDDGLCEDSFDEFVYQFYGDLNPEDTQRLSTAEMALKLYESM